MQKNKNRPGYKKTKVGWIPEEWNQKPLGKVAKLQAGKFIAAKSISEDDFETAFPCYGGNGLRGYVESYSHEGEYPLVGRQGALCGNVCWATGKFYATEHAVVATPREETSAKWLYYQLMHLNLNRYATGVAQPGLSVQVLNPVFTQTPTYSEQKAIAEVLGCWDEGLETIEKLIDEKKLHKKGLMQKLLTGEKRLPGFSKDWKTVKLGTVASIPKKKKIESVEGETLLIVKLHCLGIEQNESTRPKLTKKGRPYFKRMAGEFLIGRQNFHNGGFGIVPKELDGMITSNAITTLEIDATLICESFLLKTFSNPDYYKRVGHRMDGTGQKELSEKQILKLDIPYPSLEEQKAIAEVLETADEEIRLLEAERDALADQKKGLMQKLLTGEKRLPAFQKSAA